jgi:subtilisin family serine protease
MNAKLPCSIVILAFLAPAAHAVDTAIPFIQADDVHALGILGQKVVVAVVDAGVSYGDPGVLGRTAPRGRSYLWGQVVGDGAADPGDDHGTVVALEIVAGGANPGVAPAAKILSVQVVHSGTARTIDVRKAVDYATRQKQPWLSPGIRVINLSLGSGMHDCPCDSSVTGELLNLRDAIRRAKDAGILTVACTGNNNYCGSTWAPACFSDVLPVVASYDDGQYPWQIPYGLCTDSFPVPARVTCISNIADCPNVLAAPGYDIDVGSYYDSEGTSVAAPLVSGVAALRYSKFGCRVESPNLMKWVLVTQSDVAYPPITCPETSPMHVNAWKAVTYGNPATAPGAGDMDCDGNVCAYDFPPFAECMTGPGSGPVIGFCLEGDFAGSPPDGDVDLRDLYSF